MSGDRDLVSAGMKDGAKARMAYKETSSDIKLAVKESAANVKKAVGK